ncbi:hypothetical protein ABKN59_005440 [Abortiporus biennis]
MSFLIGLLQLVAGRTVRNIGPSPSRIFILYIHVDLLPSSLVPCRNHQRNLPILTPTSSLYLYPVWTLVTMNSGHTVIFGSSAFVVAVAF